MRSTTQAVLALVVIAAFAPIVAAIAACEATHECCAPQAATMAAGDCCGTSLCAREPDPQQAVGVAAPSIVPATRTITVPAVAAPAQSRTPPLPAHPTRTRLATLATLLI